jgi:flavin-dependent dehydrogenase
MVDNPIDLLVVGASFAGLACARSAATVGLDTVVVDRKPEPGATPHTTGILVQEAAQAIDIPRELTKRIPGIRLYSPSLRYVDLESPSYAFWATDMPNMMRWLADQTRSAGAELRFGQRVTGLVRSTDHVTVDGLQGAARFLIGADGARSQVARLAGLGRNEMMLMGVEAEYAGVGGVDPDRLHVFLDTKLAPGYIAWVVPGIGVTQVGLACDGGRRPDLPAFVERLERVFDFSKAQVTSHRAGPIPVGGSVSPTGAERIALVGDSAGHVSPLTAGGIHNALELGRLAGRAVADHLLDGGPHPASVLERHAPANAAKQALRRAWNVAPPNRLIDALAFSRPALAMARLVFFHHRGLLSVEGWKALTQPAVEIEEVDQAS